MTPRQVATKVVIKEFLEGTFLQEDAPAAPGLILPSTQQVSRLNIMGIVLHKEKVGNITTFLIDDGSGKAAIRFFEETPLTSLLTPGEAILIIGKPRRYNQERYISPEIVKKVSLSWLKLRAAELAGRLGTPQKKEGGAGSEDGEEKRSTPILPNLVEERAGGKILPNRKLIQLISSLDLGEGVKIEEIIERSPLPETENILEKMLETGEIFQVLPGRIKVL